MTIFLLILILLTLLFGRELIGVMLFGVIGLAMAAVVYVGIPLAVLWAALWLLSVTVVPML